MSKDVTVSTLALILVVCTTLFVACEKNEPDQPRRTVRFWHTFNAAETETILRLVDKFEKDHPQIDVEMTVLSFGAARNKLLEAMATDDGPDVARAEVAWIGEFAVSDLIVPASDVDLGQHISQVGAFVQRDGKVWAYPQSVDCLVLFYNKRLLAEAGETGPPRHLDELLRVSRRLTVDTEGRHSLHPEFNGDKVAVYGFNLRGDGYAFLPFLWAFGASTLDPATGDVGIADPEAVAAANFVRDLRLRHRVVPLRTDFANEYRDELRMFGSGKVAMIVNGPWATNEILDGAAFKDPSNLGVAPVPRGSRGEGGSPVGGHGYVVSARSRSAGDAHTLAKFLSSEYAQLELAKANNVLPTRTAVFDDPALGKDARTRAFRLALEQGHERAVFVGMARLFDALTPALRRILLGEGKPEELLATVAKEWKEILAASKGEAGVP